MRGTKTKDEDGDRSASGTGFTWLRMAILSLVAHTPSDRYKGLG